MQGHPDSPMIKVEKDEVSFAGQQAQRARDVACFGSETYSAEWRASLDQQLAVQLTKREVLQRPGPGGSRLTYIEGWRAVDKANRLFGFNGWSSQVTSITTEFIDEMSGARFNACASAVVRVTLRDGTYHEDTGSGVAEGMRSKGEAVSKARKEAVTDARKRALKNFGNALGNSLYDREHLKTLARTKVDTNVGAGPRPAVPVRCPSPQTSFHNNQPPFGQPPRPGSAHSVPGTYGGGPADTRPRPPSIGYHNGGRQVAAVIQNPQPANAQAPPMRPAQLKPAGSARTGPPARTAGAMTDSTVTNPPRGNMVQSDAPAVPRAGGSTSTAMAPVGRPASESNTTLITRPQTGAANSNASGVLDAQAKLANEMREISELDLTEF